MTPGPKPKPNQQKLREGNPGRRPINTREPIVAGGIPDCPDHLDVEAKAEWERLAVKLHAAGILTHADRAVMAGYCELWSRSVEASKKLQENGTIEVSSKGIAYLSPYFNALSSVLKQLKAYAAELGLTPSSRSRIQVDTEQVDELEDFANAK